jgi:hypothetical protein
MKRIFLNETGQMTVFVALIFQVLFVFFAMVINIGLLVHDKINLQNAVDLGAYYGAQRQAEILNEIAHINYQIRQDNKLLAWRYWVLGTLGRGGDGHPTPPAMESAGVTHPAGAAATEYPSICIANAAWVESKATQADPENYCYRNYGAAGAITRIPRLVVIAPFIPAVVGAAINIGVLRNNQAEALSNQGGLNWAIGSFWLLSYKMALTSRKAVIQRLRANLVSPQMVDQDSQSVSDGVLQTIRKNLTVANLNTFAEDDFKFTNGLATSVCAGGKNDGDPTIKEIRTTKGMLYTYTTIGNDAQVNVAPMYDTTHADDLQSYDPSGILRGFANQEYNSNIDNSQVAGLNASSLGFEKNPWCMAYVAVHAKSTPRKPFAPFGQPVELVARAFAQPFGGRIGPWYRSRWAANGEMSSGARVDPVSTPRLIGDANEGGEPPEATIPNYGRYPGDTLGMKELNHQGAFRNLVRPYYQPGAQERRLSIKFFINGDQIPKTGDPLAWDYSNQDQTKASATVAAIRQAESAAVAPDLFDATYYSIDLNYDSNYRYRNASGTRFQGLPSQFGNQISVAPDLGGRIGTSVEGFNVQSQIQIANQQIDSGLRNLVGYFLFSQDHVLTSWAPNTNSSFAFPEDRFAKCSSYAKDAKYMIPGVCTNGGRVGYSVRIISRDHLRSDKWEIGGEGEKGAIKNPPPLDF